MIENTIGKRYADALSDSISETAQLIAVLESLQAFCRAFQTERRLSRFFAHPGIPPEAKLEMVGDLCDRLQVADVVRRLAVLLAGRKKILFLRNITQYFEQVVNLRLNQARVRVTAAHPLSEENIQKLKGALERILKKKILIDTAVDPSLIGGVVLHVGDLVADATIRNRLAILRRTIEKEEVV